MKTICTVHGIINSDDEKRPFDGREKGRCPLQYK